MRELTDSELTFVSGGGNYSGGFSKGFNKGADGKSLMDHANEASRRPSNNPGWNNSLIGRTTRKANEALHSAVKGGGTPNLGDYDAMGNYYGGSGDGGNHGSWNSNTGGHQHHN